MYITTVRLDLEGIFKDYHEKKAQIIHNIRSVIDNCDCCLYKVFKPTSRILFCEENQRERTINMEQHFYSLGNQRGINIRDYHLHVYYRSDKVLYSDSVQYN